MERSEPRLTAKAYIQVEVEDLREAVRALEEVRDRCSGFLLSQPAQ